MDESSERHMGLEDISLEDTGRIPDVDEAEAVEKTATLPQVPTPDEDNETQESHVDEDEVRAEKLRKIEKAERSINSAYSTGKAERSKITRMAQLDAAEAVAMVGIAMEADEEADEAMRISVIAQKSGDNERLKKARKREREARKQAREDHRAATRSAKQAYEAIKFSAPNRMGFMRVVMVGLAVHIVGVLLSLIMTSRDTVTYDSNNLFTWIMVVLEGVAFWLFANRLKVARPFMIAVSVFALVADIIFALATHNVGAFSLVTDSFYYIFLILYFSLSKRVKMVLVNDFGSFEDIEDDFEINRAGWPFVRNLIVYFIVFSVLGHWMEAAMCQLIRLGLVAGEYDPTNTMLWRDWFYPFPMEGAAVVIIALALYPLFERLRATYRAEGRIWVAYLLSFLANGLTCSLIEFTMGIIINADHQLWDYSDMFLNIMGQVCLQNALAFGAAASIITWFVYPQMERAIARIPVDIMNIVSVAIFGIGGILWSLYIVDPPENHTLEVVNEASEQHEQERTELMIELSTLRVMVENFEESVDRSATFEIGNVKGDIDNLRALLDVISRDLGLETADDADQTDEAQVTADTTQGEDASTDVQTVVETDPLTVVESQDAAAVATPDQVAAEAVPLDGTAEATPEQVATEVPVEQPLPEVPGEAVPEGQPTDLAA